METNRFDKALEFASKKHEGQFRVGGKPYISHPFEVAKILKEKGYGEDYQIAGLFHDLLEDTDATEEEILSFSNENVLNAVKLLTKEEGYIMDEYVNRIKNNPIAKAIKAADRLHNLRCASVCDENFKRRYILETIDYYLDFSNDIKDALLDLSKTLKEPLYLNTSIRNELNINTNTNSFVIKGDICYNKNALEFKTYKNGYLVCINGLSKGCFETLPEEYKNLPLKNYENKLIIPALVDLHIHAPQFTFKGINMDYELLDWLNKCTFIEENKYSDLDYADKAYSIFAESMNKSATGYACIFATTHRKATEILMDHMNNSGLICYVGKVNMDREAPSELLDKSAEHSALETYGWVNSVLNKYEYVKPILTPRFIPSCSSALLIELAKIQEAFDLPLQSHLSENKGEIDFVKKLEPDSLFYGDAFNRYGLFGLNHNTNKKFKTIMAHCVYSSEEEIKLMKDNEVFVAHCPSSNVNLSSGIAPIKKYMYEGLNIGLGSDVAGGHSESMLRVICDTVQMSKLYWRLIDKKYKPLTFVESFYLASLGGGKYFGAVGSLDEGYHCSFVVLDDSSFKNPNELTITQRIERAAYSALDSYGIVCKYICGNKVYDRN